MIELECHLHRGQICLKLQKWLHNPTWLFRMPVLTGGVCIWFWLFQSHYISTFTLSMQGKGSPTGPHLQWLQPGCASLSSPLRKSWGLLWVGWAHSSSCISCLESSVSLKEIFKVFREKENTLTELSNISWGENCRNHHRPDWEVYVKSI